MNIIKPQVTFEDATPNIGQVIEKAARTCYKSHDKMCEGSAERLFNQIVKQHHHDSVAEHGSIILQVVTDRAVLAQLTRHRHFSFSVESQRYVNYSKDKFGNEIKVIKPEGIEEGTMQFDIWSKAMQEAEHYYFTLINSKCKPEVSRSVLPNSTAVELTLSGNVRQWRQYFKLRTSSHAQADIKKLTFQMHQCMIDNGIPGYLFDDIISTK
jgi:thymidylate synthase (FAD)